MNHPTPDSQARRRRLDRAKTRDVSGPYFKRDCESSSSSGDENAMEGDGTKRLGMDDPLSTQTSRGDPPSGACPRSSSPGGMDHLVAGESLLSMGTDNHERGSSGDSSPLEHGPRALETAEHGPFELETARSTPDLEDLSELIAKFEGLSTEHSPLSRQTETSENIIPPLDSPSDTDAEQIAVEPEKRSIQEKEDRRRRGESMGRLFKSGQTVADLLETKKHSPEYSREYEGHRMERLGTGVGTWVDGVGRLLEAGDLQPEAMPRSEPESEFLRKRTPTVAAGIRASDRVSRCVWTDNSLYQASVQSHHGSPGKDGPCELDGRVQTAVGGSPAHRKNIYRGLPPLRRSTHAAQQSSPPPYNNNHGRIIGPRRRSSQHSRTGSVLSSDSESTAEEPSAVYMMNSFPSFLDASGPNMSGNIPRQPPSPSQQPSHPANGVGGNGMPIANGLPNGGQTTDMNYLWSVIQTLSEALAENRASAAALVNGVAQLQARAAQEGLSPAVQPVNGELGGASSAAEVANLQAQLSAAQRTIDDFQQQNESLRLLVADYEGSLALVLEKLRPYAYQHTQATISLHRHYNEIIERERQTNLELRLEHADWQARLGRAANFARMALKEQSEASLPYLRRIQELKQENAVLRGLEGWDPASDSSDDEGDGEEQQLMERKGATGSG